MTSELGTVLRAMALDAAQGKGCYDARITSIRMDADARYVIQMRGTLMGKEAIMVTAVYGFDFYGELDLCGCVAETALLVF